MSYDGYLVRAHHGGWCCGMTHVEGFTYGPGVTQPKREQRPAADQAAFAKDFPSYYSTFNEELPSETGAKRLARLVEYTTKGSTGVSVGRRQGVIEVVLISYQNAAWKEELLKQGFKLVNTHTNSNTRHTLYIYHLNTG